MDKGAHFHKCDLQLHSPRDLRWTGAQPVTDEDRLSYARKLVEACRERGMQAIAITDHHDMAFTRYVRQAAADELGADGTPRDAADRLVVFPGMELTLGVPCQALLLFDADLPEDIFSLALTALAITPSPATEKSTAPTVRLDGIGFLKQLKDDLDKHQFLRGRYTVLPNVTDSGGGTLLRQGLAGKYAEMPWVGGYVDGSISKLGNGNRTIVNGKSAQHGHKRIAVIQTSDNRREDHNDLGVHSTWVKWAVPTAEALRQAFLAQESRISHTEPVLPQRLIEAMSVSNSAFLGPVEIDFSQQYTALIGGRGTGKSTILEYLRWGLCDQAPTAGDDTPRYEQRRDHLVAETLKPHRGKVEVRCRLNGVPHVVRRDSDTGEVLLKAGGDDYRKCSEVELRAILPIQAYSQKQLSDVSVRTNELVRFVTAPIQEELNVIDVQLGQAADEVRSAFERRRSKRKLASDIHQHDLSISSLQQQLEALKKGITGLSADDRQVMDSLRAYNAAEQSASAWRRHAEEIGASASNQVRRIDDLLAKTSYTCEHDALSVVSTMCSEFRGFLADARRHLDAVAQQAAKVGGGAWDQWAQELQTYKGKYDAAVRQHSTHSESAKALTTLEVRLGELRSQRATWEARLSDYRDAEAEFDAAREGWRAILAQRSNLLAKECERLTAASSAAIKAEVKRASDVDGLLDKLRQAVVGSNLQRTKIDAVGKAISEAADPVATFEGILADPEALAQFDSDRDGKGKLPLVPALKGLGWTANDASRVSEKLTLDSWISLALTPLKDVPTFLYRAREGEHIPFSNASAGQQATALLKTLLNQPGPPLIIDQPEEDLDNPVIHEIVQQLWSAKTHRQIIFASHNANLVVNGDAELVVWCDYRRQGDQSGGKVAGEGAIDVTEVRDAIKRVMEGGEDAFNLRMRKYGF